MIDDDPNIAEYIRRGCRTLLPMAVILDAHCGADATHIMARTHIDLIILDLVLTTESGFDLISELRVSAPRTPIIMLSVHDSEASRHVCQHLGAGAYEKKPTDAQGYPELIAKMKQHFAFPGQPPPSYG